MIGVSEEENKLVAVMKKEKYKAELLKQIGENKRNKVRAKTLERRVGATGATKKDLQKKETQKNPSRSSQQGFNAPLMKCSELETGAPRDEALLDHSSETSHRNLLQGLGDMAVPRAAGLDPVVCPLCYTPLHACHPFYGTVAYAPPPHNYGTVAYAPPPHNYGTVAYAPPPHNYGTVAYAPPPHNYGTVAYAPPPHHDGTAAYAPPPHNDGTAGYAPPPHNGTPLNPTDGASYSLEPTLPDNQDSLCRETSQSGRPIGQRSSAAIELCAENSRQQRESKPSHWEALRQQIDEREKLKKMEKREEERHNAKIEAERMAYNPWGRGGGGAPVTDKQGNLYSDLRQMHKVNEEQSLNPRCHRAGAQVPFSRPPSALTGERCSEQVNKHNQELKQQIEERRRRKAEEKEREMREEIELDNKIEKERALLLKMYEEEQKQLKIKKEIRKQVRPMKEIVEVLQKTQEEHSHRKHEEHTVSAPTERPHPEGIPQLQSHQQDVIRKLSALRGYLRKEEKQLEVQVHQTQTIPDYIGSNRRQSRADNFRSAPKEAPWTLVYRHFPAPLHVNKDNIRKFDQLKHRECLEYDQSHQRNTSGHSAQRDSILESDSTFIENKYEENDHHQRSSSPSAGSSRRMAPQSRSTRAKWTHSSDQRKHETQLQQCNMRKNVQPRNHSSTTERLPENNEDDLSLHSTLDRCVSTETVATEAWMRPGTSDAVKLLREEHTPGRIRGAYT
ncbi:centrosome and spindle pole associated protein 1-like [Gouania willdenowi]|uniref:centrosome and spindle pole associated protein 1-like n=1 Tax=Gouania willdenowi TaxID=441366 RepID=UPI0010549AB9|nr:centrosome and spindle pole associated protein 1-like [Gouania willdenowi]